MPSTLTRIGAGVEVAALPHPPVHLLQPDALQLGQRRGRPPGAGGGVRQVGVRDLQGQDVGAGEEAPHDLVDGDVAQAQRPAVERRVAGLGGEAEETVCHHHGARVGVLCEVGWIRGKGSEGPVKTRLWWLAHEGSPAGWEEAARPIHRGAPLRCSLPTAS